MRKTRMKYKYINNHLVIIILTEKFIRPVREIGLPNKHSDKRIPATMSLFAIILISRLKIIHIVLKNLILMQLLAMRIFSFANLKEITE